MSPLTSIYFCLQPYESYTIYQFSTGTKESRETEIN